MLVRQNEQAFGFSASYYKLTSEFLGPIGPLVVALSVRQYVTLIESGTQHSITAS